MKLNSEQKQSIAILVENHVQSCASQNAAAKALKDVSAATLSQIKNGNWELINDKMWLSLAKQLGWEQKSWVAVPIKASITIKAFLNDAANWSIVHGLIGDAGTGKTETAKAFVKEHDNAFHVVCNEFWNKKQFLSEILAKMGEDASGLNAYDMVNRIVSKVLGMSNPVLIFDEVDKLNDGTLYLFITLYNQLEDKCGIVTMATDHFEKRITKGIKLSKKGYKEIYSRLGKRFIQIPPVSSEDVASICKANGVDNPIEVSRIVNTSADETSLKNEYKGDIRRAKKSVITLLNKQAENN